jgi:tetratricopeptide (TPR) repeat protein
LFAAKQYEEAEQRWSRALGLKEHLTDVDLQVALLSNRSEVRLRLKSFSEALHDAQAALDLQPAHAKALFRAAVAASELKMFKKAGEFVTLCLELSPDHKEANKMRLEIEKFAAAEETGGLAVHADTKETVRDHPSQANDYSIHARGRHSSGSHGNRRTVRERALDAEEEAERRETNARVTEELRRIPITRRGEPVRFEQAATEVYCWWPLPREVSASEITVDCMQGGAALSIVVRDVVIFEQKLFDCIKGNATLWSLEDHELHLTLTKVQKDKLWEQLSQVPDIIRDESGETVPESVPESMSAAQRVALWKQMVVEDDGERPSYDELDRTSQKYVDTVRRFEHARATGDKQALAEAEMDLEDFGRMVI